MSTPPWTRLEFPDAPPPPGTTNLTVTGDVNGATSVIAACEHGTTSVVIDPPDVTGERVGPAIDDVMTRHRAAGCTCHRLATLLDGDGGGPVQ